MVGAKLLNFSAEVQTMSANRPPSLGTPALDSRKAWVQVERAAMEEMGRLSMQQPRAAAVLQAMISHMGHQNAVVISQKTIAALLGCSTDTVQRAIAKLMDGRWIQVVKLNGPGTVNAYVINDRVAWGEKREMLGRVSVFSAAVVAAEVDQSPETLTTTATAPLRRIPVVFPGEHQLPAGPGLPPPSQPFLPDMEPDLPARKPDAAADD